MAVSIGGILYSVGMNTSGFEAGAKKIESTEAKIQAQMRKNMLSQEQDARKLDKLRLKLENAKAEYAKRSQALTEKSTKEEIKAVEKLSATYKKLEEAYNKADEKLQDKIETDELNIRNMREEALIAQKEATTQSGGIKQAMSSLTGNLAGIVSVGAFKQLIDNLDAIGKRARDIGMTASQLQELQHQAKLAGISSGALDSSIKAFNRNLSLARMGTGEAKSALEGMGIALQKANGSTKTQSELLQETARFFSQNAGDAENAGRASRIFGESGVELLRIFEQGEDVVQKVFDADGIDEASQSAERFNDALENIQNVGFKLGASVVEGWGHIVDFFTNDIINGIGDAKLKRHMEKLNADARKRQIELDKARAESVKKQQQEAEKVDAILKKLDDADDEYTASKISNADMILNYQNRINNITKELEALQNAGKINEEYEKLYLKRIDLMKQLDTAQNAVDGETKAREKEQLRLVEAKRKEAEAEAKKLAEKQKQQMLARQEFELQFKIAQLEKGNAKQQAQAEAIKNAIKRNELMEKYGYDIETATRALKAQKELEKQGNTRYTQADIDKAKKVLERGQKGSIGEKTLEQAKAIVEGRELGNDRVAMFKDVQAQQQGLNFAPTSEMGGLTTPTPMTPTNAQAMQGQNPLGNATPEKQDALLSSISEMLEQILEKITEIPTSVGDTLKEVFSE